MIKRSLLLLTLLFISVPAQAQTEWTGLGDGVNWSDAGNWDNGVPNGGTAADINLVADVNIAGAPAAATSLSIGAVSSVTVFSAFGGNVFNSGSFNLTNGAQVVGDFASLAGSNATIDGVGTFYDMGLMGVSGGDVIISGGATVNSIFASYGAQSAATLTLTGAGTSMVHSLQTSIDGNTSTFDMVVSDGANFETNTFSFGVFNTAASSLTVTGSGTTWADTLGVGVVLQTEDVFINILDGATATLSNFDVGTDWGGFGTAYLNVGGGASLTTANSNIGTLAAFGIATVTGAGSEWQTAGVLTVGSGGFGQGELVIEDGAIASAASLVLGSEANGYVTVDGAGSELVIAGSVLAGSLGGYGEINVRNGGFLSTGDLTLAEAGSSATLDIRSGGTVISGDVLLGHDSGGGTVFVSGANSNWTMDSLNIVTNLGSGDGSASIALENGGRLTVLDDTITAGTGAFSSYLSIYIGQGAGAGILDVENIIMDPNNAVLFNSVSFNHNETDYEFSTNVTGYMAFNHAGTGVTRLTGDSAGISLINIDGGEFVISDGGTVETIANNTDVAVDAFETGTFRVTGAGSSFLSFGGTNVATDGGQGYLVVEDGGRFENTGDIIIGAFGGVGDLTITDSGTLLLLNSSGGFDGRVVVGDNGGTGSFLMNQGAVLESVWLNVGEDIGSVGTAVISGAGTTVTTEFILVGGNGGDGSLIVEEGATIIADQVYIGGVSEADIIVRGVGTTWTVNNNGGGFYVGQGGISPQVTVVIEDGAVLTSDIGMIGSNTEMTVRGTGTLWDAGSYIDLGGQQDNNSTLTISNGATVAVKFQPYRNELCIRCGDRGRYRRL